MQRMIIEMAKPIFEWCDICNTHLTKKKEIADKKFQIVEFNKHRKWHSYKLMLPNHYKKINYIVLIQFKQSIDFNNRVYFSLGTVSL